MYIHLLNYLGINIFQIVFKYVILFNSFILHWKILLLKCFWFLEFQESNDCRISQTYLPEKCVAVTTYSQVIGKYILHSETPRNKQKKFRSKHTNISLIPKCLEWNRQIENTCKNLQSVSSRFNFWDLTHDIDLKGIAWFGMHVHWSLSFKNIISSLFLLSNYKQQ